MQGESGLCPAHAVAVALRHSLQSHYHMWLEPGKPLDRMLDDCMPGKSQWPDQFVLSQNELQVKASTAFWRFSVSQRPPGTSVGQRAWFIAFGAFVV